jgi:hypothetical protein
VSHGHIGAQIRTNQDLHLFERIARHARCLDAPTNISSHLPMNASLQSLEPPTTKLDGI